MDDVIKLIETLKKGVEADKLLALIFSEIGPYANRELSTQTLTKLQNYFNFDDNE